MSCCVPPEPSWAGAVSPVGLLEAPSLDETLARQEAVRELTARASLREEIALLGEFEFQGAKWETFAQWLDSPVAPFRSSARLLAMVASSALALLLLVGFDRGLLRDGLLPWMAALAGFHAIYGLARREQTRAAIESLRLVASEIGVFRRGLDLMGRQTFRSPKLNGLVRRVGCGGAARSVRTLERLVRALEMRNHGWFYWHPRIQRSRHRAHGGHSGLGRLRGTADNSRSPGLTHAHRKALD